MNFVISIVIVTFSSDGQIVIVTVNIPKLIIFLWNSKNNDNDNKNDNDTT